MLFNNVLGDSVKFIFSLIILLGVLFIITIPKPILHELKPREIEVSVSGEVKNEGKMTITSHSTIGDLLPLLILTNEAEIQYLNKDQVLFHNDKIIIPSKEERMKVSINTATINELIQLPGIGVKTAEAIISYRVMYGLFQNLEELMHVKGIGANKYAKLVEFISL